MSQLSLFDVLDEMRPRTFAHAGSDGCARLLRVLVRNGLPEDAFLSAASLVLALDAEATTRRGAGT